MRAREFVNEVKMSPSSVERMTKDVSAHAGMEFEMYAPNIMIGSSKLEGDRRPSSIWDVVEFFHVREGSELYNYLEDEYNSFAANRKNKYWSVDKKPFMLREYLGMEFSKEEVAKILSNATKKQKAMIRLKAYLEDHPEFESKVKTKYNKEYAYNLDDGEVDAEFLEHLEIEKMSDALQKFQDADIYWPSDSKEKPSGTTIEELAELFKSVVNTNVIASRTYHGVARDNTSYIIEPDASLTLISNPGDAGIEIISPPLPLPTMLEHLSTVIDWAKNYGCYTNKSCGLHMNVSLDDVPMENLDYVKLALFVGDRYILREYERLGNIYAASSVNDIQRNADPKKALAELNKMKNGLAKLAHKVIHDGITAHRMSLSVHDKYVEFRHPGGNWLNIDIGKLKNTLLRFVAALDIACDPSKYQKEYATKLVKLMNPTDNTTIQKFIEYSMGIIDSAELKAGVKKMQHTRYMIRQNYKNYVVTLDDKSSQSGPYLFDVFSSDTKFFAKDPPHAIELAKEKWGPRYHNLPDSDFIVQELD